MIMVMMIGRILKRMKYKYGAERYRQMLFDKIVQQSLSRLLNKTQQKPNGDKSLEGLVIDWHLANTEMGFDNFVEPVQNDQPTYAYA